MNENVENTSEAGPPSADAAVAPTVDSQALLGPARELVIMHRGERYVLRVTRQGKLLLNK